MEWVAITFSRGSFQPRDQTQISCIEDSFFTICATITIFFHMCHLMNSQECQRYWFGHREGSMVLLETSDQVKDQSC